MTALTKWPYFEKTFGKAFAVDKIACFLDKLCQTLNALFSVKLQLISNDLRKTCFVQYQTRNESFEQLGYSMSHYPGTSIERQKFKG